VKQGCPAERERLSLGRNLEQGPLQFGAVIPAGLYTPRLSLTKVSGVFRLRYERIDDSGMGPLTLATRSAICFADKPSDASFKT
jgi:hypothetical protein